MWSKHLAIGLAIQERGKFLLFGLWIKTQYGRGVGVGLALVQEYSSINIVTNIIMVSKQPFQT